MTHDQIEAYRVKKTEILAKNTNVYDSLVELAKEVGASITNRDKGYGKASIPQLVENIDLALQTASMIETCRIATENCDIAQRATKAAICHYRIAAGIAILAMIAAWVAVFINK